MEEKCSKSERIYSSLEQARVETIIKPFGVSLENREMRTTRCQRNV